MKVTQDELKQRMKHFEDALRRAGVKITHQRLEIFRELAKTSDHPDAEAIYKGVRRRIPTVSLDTVYRTLWLLFDLGLITSLGPPRDRVRFDANTDAHHHFICTKCGMIRDFYCDKFDQLKLPDTVESFGRVDKTQIEIKGLCLQCSRKK